MKIVIDVQLTHARSLYQDSLRALSELGDELTRVHISDQAPTNGTVVDGLVKWHIEW